MLRYICQVVSLLVAPHLVLSAKSRDLPEFNWRSSVSRFFPNVGTEYKNAYDQLEALRIESKQINSAWQSPKFLSSFKESFFKKFINSPRTALEGVEQMGHYFGFPNNGVSCYLASYLQTLLRIPEIINLLLDFSEPPTENYFDPLEYHYSVRSYIAVEKAAFDKILATKSLSAHDKAKLYSRINLITKSLGMVEVKEYKLLKTLHLLAFKMHYAATVTSNETRTLFTEMYNIVTQDFKWVEPNEQDDATVPFYLTTKRLEDILSPLGYTDAAKPIIKIIPYLFSFGMKTTITCDACPELDMSLYEGLTPLSFLCGVDANQTVQGLLANFERLQDKPEYRHDEYIALLPLEEQKRHFVHGADKLVNGADTVFVNIMAPGGRDPALNQNMSFNLEYVETLAGKEYDLTTILRHSGSSMNSGHYYIYSKSPLDNKWRCFNDDSVTEVTDVVKLDDVRRNVYNLVYRAKKPTLSG